MSDPILEAMRERITERLSLDEIPFLREIWKREPGRAKVALCPNCLVEREGVMARPHAKWCAIGRRFNSANVQDHV